MADFEVRTTTQADRIVVAVTGECDLRSRDEMTSALQTAVRAAPLVVVDLAAVRFLDSSGLHALVSAHQTARHRGASVQVVNAHGAVAAVLELTGVIELFRPADDAGPRDRR